MPSIHSDRTDHPESRIPTWASRLWAGLGVVVLAVALAATTPAARLTIAAFDAPASAPATVDTGSRDLVKVAPIDSSVSSDASTRASIPAPRRVWPRVIRFGGDDDPTPRASARPATMSLKIDRPLLSRPGWNTGRVLASRVFVDLYRHLEAGLRHLTAPAFGSTAP